MADSARAPSLTTRTVTGASWVFIWRLSTRLMGMVSTVVLVRLLTPADFGLVALATSFSQSVDWLSSIGVREALVRDDRLDQALYDTGFTLSALRGAGMALVIAAGAWPVATFFEEPRLAQILLVLALATFLGAIENIGTVDFRRTMAFQKEFQLAVIPRMAAIAASIGTAVAFASYWALIVGIATNAVTRVLLSYRMHPYRPHLTLSAWRQIFGFSFWTWATATTQLVRDRIDTVVIGRLFGPTLVGVYSVGWEVGSLASTEVVEPVTAALFPGFAEARRSGGSVADGYFRAISATFLVTLPMGLGMSLIAAPVIRLAFGDRWMAAVPLVQVVAVVSVARVIAYISSVLLNAHGMISVQFRIMLVGLVVRVALLFALIMRFGLMGAVVAATIGIAIEEIMFLAVTFRRFRLRAIDLLRGLWRCVAATGAMALGLWWEGFGWAQAAGTRQALAWQVAAGITSGAAIYVTVLLLTWLLSGRPRGAETIFLGVLGGALRSRLRRWR